MTESGRIRLVLTGTKTGNGAIELDALVGVGEAIRKALLATARADAGLPGAKPGHPEAAIREAAAVRVVGISAGSAVLVLEPVDARLVDPAIAAFESLVQSLEGTRPIHPAAAAALNGGLAALGDSATIGVELPGRSVVTVDRESLAALQVAMVPSMLPSADHVDGWLHAVDFQPQEIRVRDASGRDWTCDFGADQERAVFVLLNQQVRVTGEVSGTAQRPRISVSEITSLLPEGVMSGRRHLTAQELVAEAMAAAGVTGPQPIEALVIEGIDDAEWAAFDEALRQIR